MSVRLQGIGVSPGVAVGRARHYRSAPPEATGAALEPPQAWDTLQRALAEADAQLVAIHRQTAERAGQESAAIFEAHREILRDPELLNQMRERIYAEAASVDDAVVETTKQFEHMLQATGNSYLQQRALDLRDIRQRLLRILHPDSVPSLTLNAPVILIADDLTPSDTVQLDSRFVLGICLAGGGPTSHTAILARSLGIPAVVGLGPQLLAIPADEVILLQGDTGLVILSPEGESITLAEAGRSAEQTRQAEDLKNSSAPAITRDGKRIEVAANAGRLADVSEALAYSAEGIGLLRTEFVFMERTDLPNETDQTEIYVNIARRLSPHPVAIRALDVGGDKPLTYLPVPREDNPFLGLRGIRLLLAHPDVFAVQLRAILRAASGQSNIRLMLPMVADVREIHQTRALLDELRSTESLDVELSLGMMIETPAAALTIPQYAPLMDFFSIGSNDLTQYTLAVDRGNAQVSHLYDGLHPAVLRLIQLVTDSAHEAERWVGLCGELAGEPDAVPLLVGLGLDELSMSPRRIPAVKAAVRRTTVADAQSLAAEALRQPDAAHIRQLLQS